MGRAHTAGSVDHGRAGTKFLGMSSEGWTKILVGLGVTCIVAVATWFLYVRDSIATTELVNQKLIDNSAATTTELDRNRSAIDENSAEIHSMQVWQSAHAATERFQAEQMAEQKKSLTIIQSDIKTLLSRQRDQGTK